MQSEDKINQIVHTKIFENQDEIKSQLLGEMEIAEREGAVSHSIGKIPTIGEIVTIFGLKYEVKHVGQRGKLRLKMKR